jgi:hypothetical protein
MPEAAKSRGPAEKIDEGEKGEKRFHTATLQKEF